MRHLAVVAMSLTLVGPALTTPSAVWASHDACAAHDVGSEATGTLTSSNNQDFWSHALSGYELHWMYLENTGNADLYVYTDARCSHELCSSTLPGGTTDECRLLIASRTLYIKVQRVSGSAVDYRLVVCHAPRVQPACPA